MLANKMNESVDYYLGKLEFSDVEDFVDNSKLDFSDLGSPGLLPEMFDGNLPDENNGEGLSAVYRFHQIPKTKEAFWELVRQRYKMPDGVRAEFSDLVEQLLELGFDIRQEWSMLLAALDQFVEDGTITFTDEAAARFKAAEISQQETIKNVTTTTAESLSWKQTGLFALLGVGFTTALDGFKKVKHKEIDHIKPKLVFQETA